jgi:hypothetical protein
MLVYRLKANTFQSSLKDQPVNIVDCSVRPKRFHSNIRTVSVTDVARQKASNCLTLWTHFSAAHTRFLLTSPIRDIKNRFCDAWMLASVFTWMRDCTELAHCLPILRYWNIYGCVWLYFQNIKMKLPYFSIDNAHLIYNAHPKLFRHSFWCIDNAHDAN